MAAAVARLVAVAVVVVSMSGIFRKLGLLVVTDGAAGLRVGAENTVAVDSVDSKAAADELLGSEQVEEDVLLDAVGDIAGSIGGNVCETTTSGVLVGVGAAKLILLSKRVILVANVNASTGGGAVLVSADGVGGVSSEASEVDTSHDSLAGHLGELNLVDIRDLADSIGGLAASSGLVGNLDRRVLLVLVVPSALIDIIIIIIVRVAVAVAVTVAVAGGAVAAIVLRSVATVAPFSGLSGDKHSCSKGDSLHLE